MAQERELLGFIRCAIFLFNIVHGKSDSQLLAYLQHPFNGYDGFLCHFGIHLYGGPFVLEGVVYLLKGYEFHVVAFVAGA